MLSSKPEDGGKFQYSLSMLDALTQLNGEDLVVQALITEKVWETYLKVPYVYIEKRYFRFGMKLKGVILRRLGYVAGWRILGKYFDPLQCVLFSLRPDLVIYPGNDAYAYECTLPAVIPIFDLMHRYEGRFLEVSQKNVYSQREFRYRNICKYAKTILVDSELGKKQVLECYEVSERKVKVLPYIVPSYVYEAVDGSVLEKFTLPNDFVLYPAQFWAHKNHSVILKALYELRVKRNVIVNAVFVGAPKNNYNEVVREISDLQLDGQVRILGYVTNSELVALYKRAKALVFASYYGPTNIPPLEAIALGCPAIVSDVHAHRDQLKEAVRYFDPDDAKGLADQIASLPRKTPLTKFECQAKACGKQFSLESYASSLYEILRDT